MEKKISDGLIVIDKPSGLSSFLAVKIAARAVGASGGNAVGRGGMELFKARDGVGLIDEDDTDIRLIAIHGGGNEDGLSVDSRNTKAEVVEILDAHAVNFVFL